MLKRANELSYVIGVFFLITSLILFVNLTINALYDKLSIYTASAFLIFGLAMMFFRKKNNTNEKV
jgi:hypothetical protein